MSELQIKNATDAFKRSAERIAEASRNLSNLAMNPLTEKPEWWVGLFHADLALHEAKESHENAVNLLRTIKQLK